MWEKERSLKREGMDIEKYRKKKRSGYEIENTQEQEGSLIASRSEGGFEGAANAKYGKVARRGVNILKA